MGINKKIIELITNYQNNKPPMTPSRCVHYPSCSNYSKECYEKFNFFKASFLTIKRIVCCTPLNKKFYDPVPLTKEEKQIEEELDLLAEPIKDILIKHYNKYPNSTTRDFIKLIFQNTFGPNHLYTPNKEQMKKYLFEELNNVSNEKEYIEDIGNGYVRVYLGLDSNLNDILERLYVDASNNTYTEKNIRIFYRKVNILASLIKKQIIDLPKKEALNYIKEYLANGITPVHHSKIYNTSYKPHYRVLKKA